MRVSIGVLCLKVLNAFRHQRGIHRGSLSLLLRRSTVLNAFRHQRGIHLATSARPRQRGRCAQRLSASKRDSPGRAGPAGQDILVLNAFRHQRGIHLGLSALDVQGSRCSTPFGIKEGFTQFVVGWIVRVIVLNAFRHQRGIHRPGGLPSRRRVEVLNAFRHQRGIHLIVSVSSAKPVMCSTPFGIKEGFTLPSE